MTGGAAAAFQDGSIYWSAGTGAHLVRGQVRAAWWGRGGITGPLGFPTANSASVAGLGDAAGQVGRFSGGALYWSSATGARVVSGDVLAAFVAAGGPGKIGFPIADQAPVTGGAAAAFQDGSIYWSAGTGAHLVRGQIRAAWWGRGGITGPLGFPTAEHRRRWPASAARPGQVGRFSGGALYWSGRRVLGWCPGTCWRPIVAAGGPGKIGFPIADQGPVTGGAAAAFQDGSIYCVGRHRRAPGAGRVAVGLVGSWRDHGPARLPDAEHRVGDRPRAATAGQVGRLQRWRPVLVRCHGRSACCPATCWRPTWPRGDRRSSGSRWPTRRR